MAPRRGGGGGGGGSISIYCDPYAYESDFSRISIAFAALFFIVYLVLGFMTPTKKKRATLNGGQPPHGSGRWTALGFSLFFAILDLVLFATWFSLQECRTGYMAQFAVSSSQAWVQTTSLVILWGVILNPVCKALHNVRGSTMSKLITVGHPVYIGWLIFLKIVWLSVYTAMQHLPLRGGYLDPREFNTLVKASNALYMTAAVFGLVGMLIAAASMIMALSRSRHPKTGSLKIWVYLLAFAAIVHSVLNTAFYAYFSYGVTVYDMTEELMKRQQDISLAQRFLNYFFWGLMFLSAVYILKDLTVMSSRDIPAVGPLPANPQGASGQAPIGYNPNPHVPYNPNSDPIHPNYAPNSHVAYNPNPAPSYAPYNSPPAFGNQGVSYTPAQSSQEQTNYHY